MSDLWIASYVLLWLIVVGMAFLLMGVLRQLGLIYLRLGPDPGALITPEGLARGSQAPDFKAVELLSGQPIHLSEFRGRRVLLAFLSPTCSPCRDLLPYLNEIAHRQRGKIEVISICQGSQATCMEFGRVYLLQTPLVADPTNAIGAQYDAGFTPFAFVIDEEGIILIRGVVNTLPQLEALLSEEGTLQGQPWQPAAKPASLVVEQVVSNES